MEKSFALFIDNLRESRNITKQDFCKNVISERQYYRFLKGESNLKSDALLGLLSKLELDYATLLESFSRFSNDMSSILLSAHIHLYNNDSFAALEALKKINIEELGNTQLKKEYVLIETISKYNLKYISLDVATNTVKELINYPKLLNNNSFNNFEINAMIFLSGKLSLEGDHQIANRIFELIKNGDMSFDDSRRHLILYPTLTKTFGVIGEVEKAKKTATVGIDVFKLSTGLNILESLYYLKALAERDLNNKDELLKTLSKLFALLYAEDNELRFNEYEKLLKSKFNLNLSDLIIFKH
jgi:transcriptional regulator with XRE-family HTH domain